ncbi:MAG: FTR1 family protein [Pseudomonadota bacterium]
MSRLRLRRFILILGLLIPQFGAASATEAQSLIQLLDYIAVDYPEAVEQGKVVNESEYAEMREFSAAIASKSAALKTLRLEHKAARLKALVENKGDVTQLREIAFAMRDELIAGYSINTLPRQAPELALGQKLFAENCAGCHGLEGRGDGPLARGLAPPPTDFQDTQRAAQRSLYGLYSTISLGVEGTAMAAYPQLSEHQRWSLAAFAASLSAQKGSALDTARSQLKQAALAYATGDAREAYRLALAAYLDGFELAEGPLSAVDPALKTRIEEQMLALRSALQANAANDAIQLQAQSVDALLIQAQERMGSRKLTGAGAAFAAFIILLREGLEAILVVAALAAFLVKTGQRAGLSYLHAGWVGALVLGFATWWVSEHFFEIGGMQRELTEGLAALIAAAVMFSVGFWLHNRSQAAQWQKFIQASVKQALSSGTLWGLAGLSFIAVYRECFETVLFYQALWVQTDASAQSAVVGGFAGAALLLMALAWAIMKYSLRLPLREFFATTGILLFVLAVVFAGKGVVALQEAGWIGVRALPAPRIELLGIYPNAQSLTLQAALTLLAAYMMWRGRTPAKA